ncbi:alpha/beta hydrolase [Haliscomenobacter sp.]|uniref:alpha/beta hydrolase n=1 Tax=Haliscomenobacter sp. TaxID=2717303 RepID=UPI003BAAC121
MKLQNLLTLALGVFFAFTACKKDDDDTPGVNYPSKLEEIKFTSSALVGNFFGDPAERKVLIYTPPGYDPKGTKTYPVVYLLHGMPFGDSSYVDPNRWATMYEKPDFPKQGFKAWLDSLITAKAIAPLLVAMPDAKTKYGFCFYTNSVLQGNYEDFIAEDLVDYMDGHYKTIANRHGRSVIGHSQGGYGAVRMGLMRSETFGTVAAHVGILWLDGLKEGNPFLLLENPNGFNGPIPGYSLTAVTYGMAAAWSPNMNNPPWYVDIPVDYPSGASRQDIFNKWLAHDPYTLLDSHAAHLRTLNGLYIDAALDDPWKDLPAKFHDGLINHNVPHQYYTFKGGHFNKMFERLELSLKYCSEMMGN